VNEGERTRAKRGEVGGREKPGRNAIDGRRWWVRPTQTAAVWPRYCSRPRRLLGRNTQTRLRGGGGGGRRWNRRLCRQPAAYNRRPRLQARRGHGRRCPTNPPHPQRAAPARSHCRCTSPIACVMEARRPSAAGAPPNRRRPGAAPPPRRVHRRGRGGGGGAARPATPSIGRPCRWNASARICEHRPRNGRSAGAGGRRGPA